MKQNSTASQYLKEMGIQSWELCHSNRLAGYQSEAIILPDNCELLLISPLKPEGEIVAMFAKILASLKLELHQALHLFPEQCEQLGTHHLQWLWFAGCSKPESVATDIKILTSPLLHHIQGNPLERRNLWQQICSYTSNNSNK